MLMGLCQTEDLEGLVLVYERVHCGSLYTYLHHKVSLCYVFISRHVFILVVALLSSVSSSCHVSEPFITDIHCYES